MCNMPTESQHKHVSPPIGNHTSKRVTLHVVTKQTIQGNTLQESLYMINWRDHVQIIHPTHTFISQMHLFIVIQPHPSSTLSHVCTSQVLHTEISSHVLSTCLTDLFMHIIVSRSSHITVQPCWSPTLPDTSIHVMYRLTQRATPPHCTNPLPLTIIIKYHCFRHISLLPKPGYYWYRFRNGKLEQVPVQW